MATFPTLQRLGGQTHNPIVGDFDDKMAFDPTIRSRSEGGYVTSRARNTRNPRRWTVNYNWMSQVNKDTMKAFEDARGAGSEAFTWTNPEPVVATTHTVRFFGLISYKAHAHTNFLYWMVSFILEEV